jgi:glycosyltransferase involved in cell wall biosynthesis
MKMDYKSKIISVKREKASEKSQKEVTIVLNVYNAGKTIDSFLDSLEVQTFKDFLLLVIDDGSTDQTVEKIKRYKDKFDMVVC